MASVTDKLNFLFYLTSTNLILSHHMWLVATVLDSTGLKPQSGTKFRKAPFSHAIKFSVVLHFLLKRLRSSQKVDSGHWHGSILTTRKPCSLCSLSFCLPHSQVILSLSSDLCVPLAMWMYVRVHVCVYVCVYTRI